MLPALLAACAAPSLAPACPDCPVCDIVAGTPPARGTPQHAHLGDGVTSEHYAFIAERLRKQPGSTAHTQEQARRQQEAMASGGELKPPSAGVVETEFSHLLGAVAQSNGALGAAVFDVHGLKIGAAGVQMDPLVLAPDQVERILTAHDGPFLRSRACTPAQKEAFGCKGWIHVAYRPVVEIGYPLGIGAIVYTTDTTEDEEQVPASGK